MASCHFDIETTGLNPFKHRILTIQLKREDEIIVWKLWEEKEEREATEENERTKSKKRKMLELWEKPPR